MQEKIQVFAQNSICLRGSYVIYIDPFHIKGNPNDADYVFITHPHWDHFSLLDILLVRKSSTIFFITKEIFEELLDIGIPENQIKVVKPNATYRFDNLIIETIPAYNKEKDFHPKSNDWVGYFLTFDSVSYYIVGDSDIIKEQDQLKPDVLFIPIGGNFTMDEREAARLTNHLNPRLVIPMHYGINAGDLESPIRFKKCLNKNIACKIYFKGEKDEE